MTPLDRAIFICGSQSELVRRINGKPATGYVYHWRRNGITGQVAVDIERAVRAAIAESEDAAIRAGIDGPVTVEQLLPSLEWQRDEAGSVIGFLTPVAQQAGAG